MKRALVITCLFFLSPACVKRAPNCCAPPPVEMVRAQTHCADAWGYGESNESSIEKLKTYLLQKQVTVIKLTLEATGEGITCYGCACSRGFTFHAWVQGQHVNALLAEGFTVK